MKVGEGRRTESGRVAACIAALLGCVPISGLTAGAGRIDALEGAVTVIGRGSERPARADMEIEEGDTIRTGADAWALIEMVDGGERTEALDESARAKDHVHHRWSVAR